jgi:hypothetical protein
MEAQDEISIGGQRLMDHCGSRYCKCRSVTKIMGKFGSEGEEYNWLCLLDSISLNFRGEATTKESWYKLGDFYKSNTLVKKLFI